MVRWCFTLVLVLVVGSFMVVPASAYLTTYQCDSFFDVYFSGYGGPSLPYTGSGTALVWTSEALPPSGSSGTIYAELVSLDTTLNGLLGPMMIRESPTLQSLGEFDYSDGGGGGGGGYQIDSFFDIFFFELSVDGGQSWIPTDGYGQYSGTCDSFFDVFVEIEIPVDVPGLGTITDSNLHLTTPEPGSALALVGGLLGFVSLRLRRR